MIALATSNTPVEWSNGVRRRDFINVAAASACGVGGIAALYPLVSQMNPSADVIASGSVEVDLSNIPEGQGIKVSLGQIPVFVRHLTPREVGELDRVPLSELRHPETLATRTKVGRKQWVVTTGVCTHLQCVPLGAARGETRGEYKGYFCPCHGSHYDAAGRVRKGPAPRNLDVPQYVFRSDTVIKIGAA